MNAELKSSLARAPSANAIDELRNAKNEMKRKVDLSNGLQAENNMFRTQIQDLKVTRDHVPIWKFSTFLNHFQPITKLTMGEGMESLLLKISNNKK